MLGITKLVSNVSSRLYFKDVVCVIVKAIYLGILMQAKH